MSAGASTGVKSSEKLMPVAAYSLVVPGSHLWTVEQRASWESWLKPEDVVPIKVPAGSVMLWRNRECTGLLSP